MPHLIITADHPDVRAYLSIAAADVSRYEREARMGPRKGNLAKPGWFAISDGPTWWRTVHGGIAHPRYVAVVLGKEGRMSKYEAERIFAVAALAVSNRPTHPAHWAFWAWEKRWEVANIVQEVVEEKPMRIAIPKGVVWIEPEYSLASILSYQGAWCPAHVPFPLGTLHDYFSTQREKAGHRESSTQSADTEADEEREPTKGKRKALSDNEEMIHRGVSRKRPKRETIAAGEATKKTRAPGTNSRRVTRASTAQSLRELPVRETRSIARAAVKAAATAEVMAAPSGPLVIKIIPPSKRAGEAAMDTEATGASSEGLSPLQAAVKRSPLRGYRTPPSTQIIDACFGSSPLTEPPSSPAYSTPSEVPNSSPAPRRLWQRGHRRAPSAAESDCTELSVACSTATLVPSALESDEDSTRPGTPHETDVKDGDVLNKVKERLAVHRTPVRSSARIQERRRDSSSISSLFSLPGSPPAAKRVKRRRSRST